MKPIRVMSVFGTRPEAPKKYHHVNKPNSQPW